MSEIINVPMSGQRDLATVTAEIRAYQDAARRAVLTYCVEIGRRLVEAKSMVAHGEWGAYLKDELGFSQSTANNHMRLFEAYGADQMTLTGAAVKSQAFADLSYTQALALLALPSEEEREAFVETHDLASMSTRELQEELRRRDPSDEPTKEQLADRLDAALEEIKAVTQDAKDATYKMRQAQAREKELIEERDKAKAQAKEAAIKASAAADELAKAKAALDAAKKAETDTLKKLNDAVKNPKVPKDVLDKLRKEAEEAAEKRHEADYGALDEARAKYVKAEQEASRARQEAERLEKELKLAAPNVAIFRDRFGDVQQELFRLIASIDQLPEDKQAGAKSAVRALLKTAMQSVGEEAEQE